MQPSRRQTVNRRAALHPWKAGGEGGRREVSRDEGRDKSGSSGSGSGSGSGGGSSSGGDGGGSSDGGGGSVSGGGGGGGGGGSGSGGDGTCTCCGGVGVPSIYAGEPVDGVIAGAVAAMGEMGYYTAVEDGLLCLHRAMRRLHVAAARAAGTTPQLIGADALLPLLVWSVVHTSLPCAASPRSPTRSGSARRTRSSRAQSSATTSRASKRPSRT